MPLTNKHVGTSTPPLSREVNRRWTMAYASGLDDHNPLYLDSEATERPFAHPVFPVCLEWPVLSAPQDRSVEPAMEQWEILRGVHASHDLQLHSPLRAGTSYTTSSRVTSVKRIRAGAAQMTRLETLDDVGRPVCTTWQMSIYRGVEVEGNDAEEAEPPAWPEFERTTGSLARRPIAISQGAGNVYTECALIFNPIHSDRAIALAAGLPCPILHGTATLAHAITTVVDECLGGRADRVRRLGGKFSAMVPMPSRIEVTIDALTDEGAAFTVLNEDGADAIRGGFVCW